MKSLTLLLVVWSTYSYYTFCLILNFIHHYQCEESNSKEHCEILECDLDTHHNGSSLSRHTVSDQGERQAVEEAEAMAVGVVAVVPSVFTADAQVPLTCRERKIYCRWTEIKIRDVNTSHPLPLERFQRFPHPVYTSYTFLLCVAGSESHLEALFKLPRYYKLIQASSNLNIWTAEMSLLGWGRPNE